MSYGDDFDRSLEGDERAQMRVMIRSLAMALHNAACFISHAMSGGAELKRAYKAQAVAAIEYLDGAEDVKPEAQGGDDAARQV